MQVSKYLIVKNKVKKMIRSEEIWQWVSMRRWKDKETKQLSFSDKKRMELSASEWIVPIKKEVVVKMHSNVNLNYIHV